MTEVFEYDNILKRPICEKGPKTSNTTVCSMRFVTATKFSSIRQSVRVNRHSINGSCFCDEFSNKNYHGEYCIKNELLEDLKNNHLYKNLPLTQTLNLSRELKNIIFFCKVLHKRNYCNYLANLCVLTFYDLDKNGPCYPFYRQQTQINEISPNDEANGGSEFDGGEKLKPFLFFKNRKGDLFDKIIDFSYDIVEVSQYLALTFANISITYLTFRETTLLISQLSATICEEN